MAFLERDLAHGNRRLRARLECELLTERERDGEQHGEP